MTEKEKLQNGEYYDPRDTELRKINNNAKDLIKIYNNLPAENITLRNQIIKMIFGKCGENLRVNQPIFVDYGCNITVGSNCLINMNCTISDTGKITIGDNTLIGPDVKIYTATHSKKAEERIVDDNNGGTYIKTKSVPVVIGSNVWIGGGVIILPGVTIGDNTVIGAGSVVTKSIPANVIAYGNPCRVAKEIED